MFINLKDISISYGNNNIINDLNLDIPRGSFVALLGPNGSGKSTLLKSIYRIIKPDGGTIFLEGGDLQNLSYRDSAKKLAVVSQHNYFNFDFTVTEVVLMGRSPHKKHMERDNAMDYEIVDECLKKVDMLSFKERIFSTLSGGEQQRVILARALAQKTECLILDEPTNHLDIKHRLHILRLVKSMDITVISAVHELSTAANYADIVFILKDGKIRYAGKPCQIITSEMIKEIYEVDAKVLTTDGEIIISFNK